MRFLVDESTGPTVGRWLRLQGHEVFSVYDQARGLDDLAILRIAATGNWIIITNDKDFGEKVYREHLHHEGVILLRLENEHAANKIATIQHLLTTYAEQLPKQFVVVTEARVRFAR